MLARAKGMAFISGCNVDETVRFSSRRRIEYGRRYRFVDRRQLIHQQLVWIGQRGETGNAAYWGVGLFSG